MKNHLNILPKLASFDLKCSKMRWPRPPNRKRQRAFSARHSLVRVHFYISIPLSGPPYGIPGSATGSHIHLQYHYCHALPDSDDQMASLVAVQCFYFLGANRVGFFVLGELKEG